MTTGPGCSPPASAPRPGTGSTATRTWPGSSRSSSTASWAPLDEIAAILSGSQADALEHLQAGQRRLAEEIARNA
ncbi:hypothetical protein M2168_000959 [Streptomyces sp. CZ24]|nr:hypothetical protein [Streptomyces sp. CZ24]